MEDGASTPNISDSIIDFNLINELLFDGFWLEATTESNFWEPGPTTLSNLNSSSSYFPTSDINTAGVNTKQHQEGFPKGAAKSDFLAEPAHRYLEMDEISASQSPNQSPNFLVQESQLNRKLWVGPNRSPVHTISVKKRLVQAINCLKDSIQDKDVLVQIWIPVKREGRQVLTTNNQPFSLNPNCKNLANYRDVSQNYQFGANENSTEFLGLPGRVFLKKLPEWTPDVRFFRREEYPRVKHAQHCDVRGSLALPVFEQGSGICLGVVEIVTTSQKVDFHPELENVCKALEAVDLKSSNVLSPYGIEDCDESYQVTLTEIRNVLKFVCNTHKLPLAQVWASCLQRRKGGSRHSDENYARCVSIIESACYVADAQVTGFHEACSQHHLLKGEGVPGKAFLTNQPCLSKDVTAFSKTEYPLAHHARVFNLCASAAIRLRSTYNRTTDFVLEFFMPLNCREAQDQMLMLHLLSSIVQQTRQNLRVITDRELAQETSAGKLDDGKHLKLVVSPPKESSQDASSRIMSMMDPQHKGKGVFVSSANNEEKPDGEFKVANTWDNSSLGLHHVPPTLEHGQLQQDPRPKTSSEEGGNFSLTIGDLSLGSQISSEKKRKRTNKAISLQVLRQYFAGSLKEAAKSIGVCPTTLKRICRQHGITRWPSRKIKKVSHSLRKLQLVMDSVQGAEGTLQLSSFYNNFPELVSPNVPGSSHLSTSKMRGHLQQVNNQPEGTSLSPATTASKSPSSSGSHSSSSSYCCSTGVKQSSFPVNSSSLGDALSVEQTGGVLKKARSDAELHEKGQQKMKPLIRSYSHKLFSNHTLANAPAMPKDGNQSHHVDTFRVKAAFGEGKIRLSLQPHWGFKDLREEILRRFKIENGSSVNLKYLDDDAEWVLLTCDDDLEECRDIHRSSKNQTVKLSVNQACYPNLGSSFGSDGPY